MTRSQVACGAGLVLVVAAVFATGQHPTHATPRPTSTPTAVRASTWQQLYADAQTAVDANSMALRAVHVTGQNPTTLHRQWCSAVAASNTADQHLGGTNQLSTKDCK